MAIIDHVVRRVSTKLLAALLAVSLPAVGLLLPSGVSAVGADPPAAPPAALPAAAPPAAPTFGSVAAMAGCVIGKINGLRASNGLDPVVIDDGLSAFAQSWSDHMASARSLAHNPDLVHAPGTWTLAGENVGVGPDLNLLFDGFVASPHHYVNLVDPDFTVVGIGVSVTATGLIYTTQDFEVARPDGSAPPSAITPAPCTTTVSARLDLSLHQTQGVEPL